MVQKEPRINPQAGPNTSIVNRIPEKEMKQRSGSRRQRSFSEHKSKVKKIVTHQSHEMPGYTRGITEISLKILAGGSSYF